MDDALDHFRHLGGRERRSDDLADARFVALRAADRDLIPLATVLVDPEHADIADVVMATGVDAAGDIQFHLAYVMLIIEVVETLGDRLCNRDRFGVGQ